jgi:hypothetical protein
LLTRRLTGLATIPPAGDGSKNWRSAMVSRLVGLSQASNYPGARNTGMRSWIGAITSFGVVVMTQADTMSHLIGQNTHAP